MLTFIVPVFDLGMSFGKFKSGNLYSKLRSKPVCRILRRVTTSFAMLFEITRYWLLAVLRNPLFVTSLVT